MKNVPRSLIFSLFVFVTVACGTKNVEMSAPAGITEPARLTTPVIAKATDAPPTPAKTEPPPEVKPPAPGPKPSRNRRPLNYRTKKEFEFDSNKERLMNQHAGNLARRVGDKLHITIDFAPDEFDVGERLGLLSVLDDSPFVSSVTDPEDYYRVIFGHANRTMNRFKHGFEVNAYAPFDEIMAHIQKQEALLVKRQTLTAEVSAKMGAKITLFVDNVDQEISALEKLLTLDGIFYDDPKAAITVANRFASFDISGLAELDSLHPDQWADFLYLESCRATEIENLRLSVAAQIGIPVKVYDRMNPATAIDALKALRFVNVDLKFAKERGVTSVTVSNEERGISFNGDVRLSGNWSSVAMEEFINSQQTLKEEIDEKIKAVKQKFFKFGRIEIDPDLSQSEALRGLTTLETQPYPQLYVDVISIGCEFDYDWVRTDVQTLPDGKSRTTNVRWLRIRFDYTAAQLADVLKSYGPDAENKRNRERPADPNCEY